MLRLGTVRLRYPGTVTCLAFSPDGKFLATGGEAGALLWDWGTGRVATRLSVPREPIDTLAFSHDGKRLAAVMHGMGGSPRAVVWEVATGKTHYAWTSSDSGEFWFNAIAYSPDGKIVAISKPKGPTQILKPTIGQTQEIPTSADVMAFSPDSKRLALVSRTNRTATVQFWDPESNTHYSRKPAPDFCTALAYSADGKRLFAASSAEIWVLDGTSAERIAKHFVGRGVPQTSPGRFADVSPVGAAVGLQGDKLIYQDESARKIRESATLSPDLTPLVALSRDGKRIAVAYGKSGLIRLFDSDTGRERSAVDEPAGHIQTLAFSPDGKSLVAYGTDRRLTVWGLPAGTRREAFGSGEPLDGVAVSHFGDRLATGAYSLDERKLVLRTWNLRTGERLHEYEVDELGQPTFLAVAPDGVCVSARQRGVCRLWDLKNGERADPDGLPTTLADIAFADDGKALLLGGRADRLVVWDGGAKRVRYTVHEPGATAVRSSVSPNGRVLGVSFANGPAVATLHDFHSGEEICMLGKHRGRFQPDDVGNVVVRSYYPGTLGQGEGQSPMAFSPDGRCVAAAGHGGVLHVWRIDTGEELNQFAAGDLVGAIAFSPDGKRLACSVAASVLVWDVSANAGKYARRSDSLSPEKLEQLWSDLASRDGARAVRAVWELADAPGPAVSFLGKRLHPLKVEPSSIEQWIKDLQNVRYATRARAQHELAKLDEAARPWLEKHLENGPSVEMRRRLELLVQPLDGPLPGAEKMRLLRSVDVLQHIGSPEACQLLERLAGGDTRVWLTGHARTVLDRLRKARTSD
jgi:WD40 repeat protein